VSWQPLRRGRRPPGRLVLSTRAPLGLFVCWSRWDPPRPQLILPAPLRGPVGRLVAAGPPTSAEAGRIGQPEGGSLWHDLRPHRPEDGPGRLAWKLLAQGRGTHSKRFGDPLEEVATLTPAPGIPLERALRHLCGAILRLDGEGGSYGLAVGGRCIAPGQGREHRDRCLELLALLPSEPGEEVLE